MNFVSDIACNRPRFCHALWVSHEFFFQLMEMGMITYEWDGRIAMFQGLELRPVERLGCDYKFAVT